jgi:hypothetical protein
VWDLCNVLSCLSAWLLRSQRLLAGPFLLGFCLSSCERKVNPSLSSAREKRLTSVSSSDIKRPMTSGLPFQLQEKPPVIEEDEPSPPGNLREEVERFHDLPACVHQHRVHDPLLQDSFDALGYENLIWDTCRTLAAIKTNNSAHCSAILSSPLRERCFVGLATWFGKPELCPLVPHPSGIKIHNPTCLASSYRDSRFCSPYAKYSVERALCEGIVLREPKRCGVHQRCQRKVQRWQGVLPESKSLPAFKSKWQVELTCADAQGKGGISKEKHEVKYDAVGGAVLVKQGHTWVVLVGSPSEVLSSASIKHPRAGFLLHLPEQVQGTPADVLASSDSRITLAFPSGILYQHSALSDIHVQIKKWPSLIHQPLELEIKTKLATTSHACSSSWTLTTWLRDSITSTPQTTKPNLLLSHGFSAKVTFFRPW